MSYALHAVIIKKPVELEKAKQEASNFIKDKKKHFFRETNQSYRFRNVPKTKFIKKSFRTKIINPEISLIYGELTKENEHLEGSGILDWFKEKGSQVATGIKTFFSPRKDSFNNVSQQTLKNYGNNKIIKLSIYRTPITQVFEKVLNIISMGKWDAMKKDYGFDKFFHLALVATVEGNKNIIIEKNDVINISTDYKTSKDTETIDVPLQNINFTINDMLNKIRQKQGDKTFFEYDAFKNNCQMFVKSLLEDSGLYNEDINNFVFQDVGELSKEISTISKIARGLTNVAGWFNKISGQGRMRGKGFNLVVKPRRDYAKRNYSQEEMKQMVEQDNQDNQGGKKKKMKGKGNFFSSNKVAPSQQSVDDYGDDPTIYQEMNRRQTEAYRQEQEAKQEAEREAEREAEEEKQERIQLYNHLLNHHRIRISERAQEQEAERLHNRYNRVQAKPVCRKKRCNQGGSKV